MFDVISNLFQIGYRHVCYAFNHYKQDTIQSNFTIVSVGCDGHFWFGFARSINNFSDTDFIFVFITVCDDCATVIPSLLNSKLISIMSISAIHSRIAFVIRAIIVCQWIVLIVART